MKGEEWILLPVSYRELSGDLLIGCAGSLLNKEVTKSWRKENTIHPATVVENYPAKSRTEHATRETARHSPPPVSDQSGPDHLPS